MSGIESTHSLLPLHYEGHQVRAYVDEMGMIWWIAKDVGDILQLKNVRMSLEHFPDDEKGVSTAYTPNGLQDMVTVSEPGLYRLIFQSRKPEAEALKRWVFHEVLPTLRRTGQYTTPSRISVAPSPHLPPPPRYPVQERAHVSEHLLAVWSTLRQAAEPLTNADIQAVAHLKEGVTRKWTRYLLHLGLLDLYETAPRHLFAIAPQADKRHAAYFQRLERLAAIMEQRQQRLFR
jgi:hypothetical protein